MNVKRGRFIPRGAGRFQGIGDNDIPPPDTGDVLSPIETVTSTASRLYDWPMWALAALALILGYHYINKSKRRRRRR